MTVSEEISKARRQDRSSSVLFRPFEA
jgi:hypothetical protein